MIDLLLSFKKFKLAQISRVENAHADILSKLANNKDSELLTVVSFEQHLFTASITREEVMWLERTPI